MERKYGCLPIAPKDRILLRHHHPARYFKDRCADFEGVGGVRKF